MAQWLRLMLLLGVWLGGTPLALATYSISTPPTPVEPFSNNSVTWTITAEEVVDSEDFLCVRAMDAPGAPNYGTCLETGGARTGTFSYTTSGQLGTYQIELCLDGDVDDCPTVSELFIVASATLPPLPTGNVQLLLSPLSPLGEPTSLPNLSAYNAYEAEWTLFHAQAWPVNPNELLGSNYYDLVYVTYQTYYRTGNTTLRNYARQMAIDWRGSINNQVIIQYMNGDWSVGGSVPPPRSLATLGLAVHCLEALDNASCDMVKLHGDLIAFRLSQYAGTEFWLPGGDARESGYMMMTLAAATVVGQDRRPEMARLLNLILERQQSDGRFVSISPPEVPPECSDPAYWGGFNSTFMNGLLAEGMLRYDIVIGDPRIIPAIKHLADYTFTTQWISVDEGGPVTYPAFAYANVTCGSVGYYPTPDLTGLFMWPFGELCRRGYSDSCTHGNTVWAGFMNALPIVTRANKQFAELFRSSRHFPGALALAEGSPEDTIAPSTPAYVRRVR